MTARHALAPVVVRITPTIAADYMGRDVWRAAWRARELVLCRYDAEDMAADAEHMAEDVDGMPPPLVVAYRAHAQRIRRELAR